MLKWLRARSICSPPHSAAYICVNCGAGGKRCASAAARMDARGTMIRANIDRVYGFGCAVVVRVSCPHDESVWGFCLGFFIRFGYIDFVPLDPHRIYGRSVSLMVFKCAPCGILIRFPYAE